MADVDVLGRLERGMSYTEILKEYCVTKEQNLAVNSLQVELEES